MQQDIISLNGAIVDIYAPILKDHNAPAYFLIISKDGHPPVAIPITKHIVDELKDMQ